MSDARYRVVAAGRRFGKTTAGKAEILIQAKKGAACWWLAPTYGMASQVWRDLKAIGISYGKGVLINESERRIDFTKHGGYIAIRSTHYPDLLRGAGLDFAVLDEAAFMDAAVWPQVVRPMLLERKGRALFLSSPNGIHNWFYDLYRHGLRYSKSSVSPLPVNGGMEAELSSSPLSVYGEAGGDLASVGEGLLPSVPPLHSMERGAGGEVSSLPVRQPREAVFGERGLGGEVSSVGADPRIRPPFPPHPLWERGAGGEGDIDRRLWRTFHFSSGDNPIIAPEELEAIRLSTPEYIWRTEYLAEFTTDVGQVFRGIRDAATAPFGQSPLPGVRYVCGLDWGRSNDSTAIVVIDADSRHVVALDRFTGVSWALQRGRLRALYDHWLPAVIWAESNSIGSPNIEALQAEGLPIRAFATTAASKPPLIESLALAIERRELALLPDDDLLGELAAYTLHPLPGGGYRYTAPAGQHDDLVIALALAWYAVNQPTILIDFA